MSALDKYARRDTGSRAPEQKTTSGKTPYLAHEGKDKQIYLKLYPYKQSSCAVDYKHLFYFEFDDEIFETLALEFGHLQVIIRGKNLGTIVTALDTHTCRYIREFHPDVHEHPGEDQPIVTQLVRRRAETAPPVGGDEDETA